MFSYINKLIGFNNDNTLSLPARYVWLRPMNGVTDHIAFLPAGDRETGFIPDGLCGYENGIVTGKLADADVVSFRVNNQHGNSKVCVNCVDAFNRQ